MNTFAANETTDFTIDFPECLERSGSSLRIKAELDTADTSYQDQAEKKRLSQTVTLHKQNDSIAFSKLVELGTNNRFTLTVIQLKYTEQCEVLGTAYK